jgi:hypothetical protein
MLSRDLGVPNIRRHILLENRGRNLQSQCRLRDTDMCQKNVELTLPHAQHKDARERCSCVCPP